MPAGFDPDEDKYPSDWYSGKRAECQCCLHQRKLGGWQKTWCQPYCVYARFPPIFQLEWALMQRCIKIVPIVMPGPMGSSSSIHTELDTDRFRLQMDLAQMPKQHWESLWLAIDRFHVLWEQYKNGNIPFGDDEFGELCGLSPTRDDVMVVER